MEYRVDMLHHLQLCITRLRDDQSLRTEDNNGEDSGDRVSNPSWRRGARATTHIHIYVLKPNGD
ncbi:hypothetical protein ES288_A12G150000v1 [Gossypium darwinii]|uniref:Uncharacterized protein n=1 Tax=Gossypium darwinii TaxID=34276 RepID=A0A5D2EAA0_GOSDA|nr:hypothetical protein ES288_A12G150000v1 [Gossypium darwinii]